MLEWPARLRSTRAERAEAKRIGGRSQSLAHRAGRTRWQGHAILTARPILEAD